MDSDFVNSVSDEEHDVTNVTSETVMRRLCPRLTRRRILVVLALLLVILIATLVFFEIYRPRDVRAYFGMAGECNRVWKDLALRRIRRGHPVERVLQLSQPNSTETFGPYTVLSYNGNYGGEGGGIAFTGVWITARDGRLIDASAASCTWDHSFFRDRTWAADMEQAAKEGERVCVIWYRTGQKFSEHRLKDGKLHGKTITWDKDGQVRSVVDHQDSEDVPSPSMPLPHP